MKTRATELLGIKHPIMLAGMNWITEPKLVAAVCNAGGLGVLAIARCAPEETRRNIREIRTLTDKPFGVNQILNIPLAKENIQVAIEENVHVINYSLGKPWFVEQVHKYGGKILGTIAIARHAVRAEQLGVDAVVVTGHEAAGHGHDATSLILIPIVASQIKIPLVAAGGFYDGRGLAAALVLGADAISMGTRFMITKESPVPNNFKQLCLEATEQDTLYSDRFDGMLGRVLKTSVTEAMMKGWFPIARALAGTLEIKRALKLSWRELIRSSLNMTKGEERFGLLTQARFAAGVSRLEKAVRYGNEKEGLLFAGQNCGGIDDIPSCQEVVERTIAEAEKILKTAGKKYL